MHTSIINIDDVSKVHDSVLTYGHFSTIHPGHIRYLKHAKSQASKLFVALIGDLNSKYPFTQSERAEAIQMLGLADFVVLLKGNEINSLIQMIRPNVLILGNEYKDNSEIQVTLATQREHGGTVQFHAGDVQYARTDLLSSSERELKDERLELFRAACKRQNLDKQDLVASISSLKEARLIVIGDTIVDQYAACEAIGMSAEAPVVVVRELERKNFLGGAAVVAAHVAALGASCDLISVIGNDEIADLVVKELQNKQISNRIVVDHTRPTTFKKRYIVDNQKLFRVSRLEDHNLDQHIEDKIIAQLTEAAPRARGIIVSDFVYGMITKRILDTIKLLASKYDLLLFGDLQCSSQVGSITKFIDFSLLCPNEREARLALQDKDSGLEQISQHLLQKTNCTKLVMKLGSDGFIAYDRSIDEQIYSQPFPALSVNPLDVAGAGDSLLAIFATALASGHEMMPTAALACCMAASAVETMGNTPISASTLKTRLEEVFN